MRPLFEHLFFDDKRSKWPFVKSAMEHQLEILAWKIITEILNMEMTCEFVLKSQTYEVNFDAAFDNSIARRFSTTLKGSIAYLLALSTL